jgi:hypothetical protein
MSDESCGAVVNNFEEMNIDEFDVDSSTKKSQ